MANISIHNAPKGYAVLPFFVTAALFFFAFSILLSATGVQIIGHYFQPKVLAIVHTLALGWATMIILGAAYQLVPVIFERELYSPKLAFFTYLLLTIGTCILIHAFWSFQTNWLMILAGSMICLCAYLYFFILWMTIKDAEKSFELNLFFLMSAFWFCFTTTVGLLLAINLAHSFFSKNHLDILKLHAHAGIAGWFLQLVLGASAKMIPMFLLGKSNKRKWLFASVILVNIGLILFLIDGYKNQVNYRALGYGALVFAGVCCWIVYLFDCYKNRARKKVDIPMRHALFSIGSLIIAFALLPLALKESSGKWITLYAVKIILGWITGIILGMTFKTLPFIVWNIRYKDMNGLGKIPMPKDLYLEWVLKLQYYLFLLSLLVTSISIVFTIGWMIRLATWMWVLLSLCYLWNVGKIITHKRKVKL